MDKLTDKKILPREDPDCGLISSIEYTVHWHDVDSSNNDETFEKENGEVESDWIEDDLKEYELTMQIVAGKIALEELAKLKRKRKRAEEAESPKKK